MKSKCEFADDCPVRRRRAQAKRLARDPKRKGELGELVFVLTAASHGLIVSKPYGDSASYDFLVQSGRRIRRVQVKAAFTERLGSYTFNVTAGRHRYYTEKDIDFLAAYIGPLDIWYIVPVHVIHSTAAIVISPGARLKDRGTRFEPYREAWHLLKRGLSRSRQISVETTGRHSEAPRFHQRGEESRADLKMPGQSPRDPSLRLQNGFTRDDRAEP